MTITCLLCMLHWSFSLCYADEVTLIIPSLQGLKRMANIFEEYLIGFDMIFNPDKNKLIIFNCMDISLKLFKLVIADTFTHLGRYVSSIVDGKTI